MTIKECEKINNKIYVKRLLTIIAVIVFSIQLGSCDFNSDKNTDENINKDNLQSQTEENEDLNVAERKTEPISEEPKSENSDAVAKNETIENEAEIQKEKNSLPSENSIMHGGGTIGEHEYPNVQEVLDFHYNRGKRIFEIDFAKTSDNHYVCLHGWDGFASRMFDITHEEAKKPMTLKEFMTFKEKRGFTQMDTKAVVKWLKKHKDAYIVTDTKDDNIPFVEYLSENSKGIRDRIIPQIYSFEEYDKAKSLGFDKIILTTYKMQPSFRYEYEFFEKNKLFGITVADIIATEDLIKDFNSRGVNVCVFTINDINRANELINQGVKYIYTDNL